MFAATGRALVPALRVVWSPGSCAPSCLVKGAAASRKEAGRLGDAQHCSSSVSPHGAALSQRRRSFSAVHGLPDPKRMLSEIVPIV